MLTDSLKKWNDVKKAKGANYQYTISLYSPEINCGLNTSIKVRNDSVVYRSLESVHFKNKNGVVDFTNTFTIENKYGRNPINSNDREGSKGVILDSIYETCKNFIPKIKTDSIKVSIKLDENGILSECVYRIKGCNDSKPDCKNDCIVGYKISSFEWLKKDDEEFIWLENHKL